MPNFAPQVTPLRGSRPHVLLTTEGTYPHYRGGVSTWCDFLIKGTPDVDYTVWTLMMNPFVKPQYEFPDNVIDYVGIPLWGIEQPAEYTKEIPSGQVFEQARRTKEKDVEKHFIPIFDRFLTAVSNPLFSPTDFASVLVEMHRYFQDWEYRSTWRSFTVWEAFKARLIDDEMYTPQTAADADLDDSEAFLPRRQDITSSFRSLIAGGDQSVADSDLYDPSLEHLPRLGDAIEGLRWIYRLMQTVNTPVPKADITHSAAAAFCAIPCILAKAERDTPFLLTEHGVYLREQYLAIERRGLPFQQKRFLMDLISAVAQTAYRIADQVSPVCEFNARWETQYGVPRDHIDVIYNGVDPEVFKPIQVQRPAAPTVVQVGRIDPLKDQLTFLRVADRVRTTIPDVQFHHYGPVADDEYAHEVEALHQELNLDGTVTFMGSTDKPAEAYNEGDVSILTSISEAFPFSVVESLMCGVPVVSTHVGGVIEAVKDVGYTARPRDIEALSLAVIEVLQMDPERQARLGEMSRARGVEQFRLDQFIERYRHTYDDLIATPRTKVHLRTAAAALDPSAAALEQAAVGYDDALLLSVSDRDEEPVFQVPTGDPSEGLFDFPVEQPVAEQPPAEEPVFDQPAAEQPVAPAPTFEPAAQAQPEFVPAAPEPEPTPQPAPQAPEPAAPVSEPAAAEPISAALLDEALAQADPFQRVQALRRIRRERELEQAVIAFLNDDQPIVRREAVAALARVGGPTAAQAVLSRATEDPAAEVREEAVRAMGALLVDDELDFSAG